MKHVIFGESHGPAIGVVLTEVPSGIPVDEAFLAAEMARRAPGTGDLTTARREPDRVEILSGAFEGKTTGTPLCMVIRNTDQHSGDYEALRELARPGHADLTGFVRYGGFGDFRGGGHFSGRLTAPLVAAGALARMILRERGVEVRAHISSVGDIDDDAVDMAEPDMDGLRACAAMELPVLSEAAGERMRALILRCREEGDSVGGTVECAVTGLPMGLGDPDLDRNAETLFARQLLEVPAVKALEFGAGFRFARMRGSEANDPWRSSGGTVRTETNHNGGILGGITTGMPVVFRVAVKPTPSIALPQRTVRMGTGEETEITVSGRHDPCIVPRAVPVIEAAAALAALDLLEGGRNCG